MVHLPEELRSWADAVNRRDYFAAAKECLYDAWHQHRSPFYHGLQIFAAGLLHMTNDNPAGARIKLDKARQRLRDYSPAYLGVDVAALLDFIHRYLEEDEGGNPGAVSVVPDAALVRGNEPELHGGNDR